eukprot:3871467-Pyramimonas_sp.AAC.3
MKRARSFVAPSWNRTSQLQRARTARYSRSDSSESNATETNLVGRGGGVEGVWRGMEEVNLAREVEAEAEC